jgi:dihydroorotate dehydrogenase electron transfer subunit
VKTESPTVKTFTFKDEECANAKPGQFLMLWIPGVDEIPLSISAVDEDSIVSVTVKNVGEATKALHGKKIGDIVGVRGPFGNSFTETGKKVLMVGGGTGMAPLSFLAESMLPKATRMIFVLGAKTRNELVFRDRLTQALHGNRTRLIMSTEDGTCGITGLCTDPLERILKEEKLDIVYACGPERMILKIFELTERHGMSLEVSLERLMRCAMGLCGSCVIGRYRVCRDGPVFTGEQLREVQAEFGLWKRDFDGRRISL